MTSEQLRVFDCPSCHAPLPPAADGAHVTCKFCQQATVVEYSGASMQREQQSRAEAEALFAKLGQPPSVSQRIAAFLVNPWLWFLGSPFLIGILFWISEAPKDAIAGLWERSHHERIAHVASPLVAWIWDTGWMGAILVALLVWSLFGERVDARRDLQAALAAKPPKTTGAHARCRHCDAEIDVPAGALGARCTYCGTDNLLQIPTKWARRARKIDARLRLDTKAARSRDAESRRRVLRASAWRVPLVAIILALIFLPATRSKRARFGTFLYDTDKGVGVTVLAVHENGEMPSHELHSLTGCENERGRKKLLHDSKLSTEMTKWCEGTSCQLAAMIALARGQRLRLAWVTPGPATLRVALAPRQYRGGVAVLWDSFGDEVRAGELPAGEVGATAAEIPIETTGWYKIDLRGPAGVAIEPCVVSR